MTCAIVDTAHIVTTHALAVGDLGLARFAAETSVEAAPYDDTAQLDMVAVDRAAGDDQRAERRFVENVLERTDDDLAPIDVPEHSADISRQRRWDKRRARSPG
ncbi:hypothetical protein [Nocardioides jensenii]|uniref:hypothetical protein n=1 Tax=Nocardioides jensenii TaxID=1843 RepID=UPI000835A9DB|nr:hypothetical protein [Nocardioides jensenii]